MIGNDRAKLATVRTFALINESSMRTLVETRVEGTAGYWLFLV